MNKWIYAAVLISVMCVAGCKSKGLRPVELRPVQLRAQETVVSTTNIFKIWPDRMAIYYGVPLGNGRQGAALLGNPYKERIVLNELTLWGGGPQEADKPDAYKYLPKIQEMLLAADKDGRGRKEAQAYIEKHFLCVGNGTGAALKDKDGKSLQGRTPFASYQNLGSLMISFKNILEKDKVDNYRRTLDMRTAVATVDYDFKGQHHSREHFISFPDKVFASRFTADGPEGINFSLTLNRRQCFTTEKHDDHTLVMHGQVPDYDDTDNDEGMKYAAYLRVLNLGGRVEVNGSTLSVHNAESVVLYQTSMTDYAGPDGKRGEDPRISARRNLNRLRNTSYEDIKQRHVADYQNLFNRVDLRFGPDSKELADMSIEERMERHAKDPTKDMSYPSVVFNFGRYLLISSCREGGLPPNLQGIWAQSLSPAWNGDYHLDINLQMNMWPAEICNLPECHSTMIDYIEKVLVPNGKKTAKAYFNVDDGWINFIQSNVWGYTSPLHRGSWSIATSATPWLCQHLWWHYDYNRDEDYLKRMYPVLKGALNTFMKGVLVKHPETGELVTAPSHSPENGGMCVAAAIDSQSVRELMHNVIKGSEILGIDSDYRKEVRKALSMMPRDGITGDGKKAPGRLMEWYRSDSASKGHRHISHMWALYPGIEINHEDTPKLAEACRLSLIDRKFLTTGWGQAHRLACWARIGDKDMFHRQFVCFAKPYDNPVETVYGLDGVDGDEKRDKTYRLKGRLLPSLFALHPPFQIDGNFGITAGIAEGLMNSYPGRLILLPALPDAWGTGSVVGLKARGNIIVNMEWKNGQLKKCVLESPVAQTLCVQYKTEKQDVGLKPGKPRKVTF
ncbi:glycoside hydrolase N-terminal domain-containing protein [Verrucomicrobiota bacterium]